MSTNFLAIETRKSEALTNSGHGGLTGHPKNTCQPTNKCCRSRVALYPNPSSTSFWATQA